MGTATEPKEEDVAIADVLTTAFARLDPVALGLAVGIVCGIGLFFATAVLLLKDGDIIGPRLKLLQHYLIGYRITWIGSLLGLMEATIVGYVIGHTCAWLHNTLISGYIFIVRLITEAKQRRDIL